MDAILLQDCYFFSVRHTFFHLLCSNIGSRSTIALYSMPDSIPDKEITDLQEEVAKLSRLLAERTDEVGLA